MSEGFPRGVRSDDDERGARWGGPFGCPPPELILPALEGALPDPPAAAIRAHLSECALCTELAVALEPREVISPAAQSRIDRRVLGDSTRPSRWFGLAAAAAVVLAAGGVYLALKPAQRIDLPAVSSPRVPAVAQVAPENVLALAAPAIELPPESLTLRSESRDAYAAALERALEYFSRGDYATSAARLERVARRYPAKSHAQFYLGAALLLRGDAAPAIVPLERARKLSGRGASLYPEATWYLAVALERSGRGAEALDPLVDLCGEGGPRSQQGCDGLSRLLNHR